MPCGCKVKAGMVHVWAAGKLCDSLVTHGQHPSALETRHNKTQYKFTFFTFSDSTRGTATVSPSDTTCKGQWYVQMTAAHRQTRGISQIGLLIWCSYPSGPSK